MRWMAMGVVLAAMACTASDDLDETDGHTDVDSDSDSDTDTAGICGSDWRATGFTDASHTKAGDLNYELIFNDSGVQRLDIVICPDDFQAMQDNMEALARTGGGGGDFPDATPSYVPALVQYGDQTWPWVGIRYKGNSTLWAPFQQGNGKLPFRLHFDKYEDDHTQIDNQRFFGFKELKFGNNFNDASLIRDKLMSDTFRDAGVAAAKGSFTRIYVDVGDGPQYWGLYTMFEDPTNALLDSWFGGDDGNMYEADGDAATLSRFDLDSFEPKTNDDADGSEVQALVNALASTQSGDAWRAELEATFEVGDYMRALAINQIVGNWDTYGVMTHNYYLYADPAVDGRLVYVPWDFNESYLHRTGRRGALSVDLGEVSSNWPLIRRTMDDPIYRLTYLTELRSVMDGPLDVDLQQAKADAYHDLIAPYVIGVDGEESGYTHLRSDAEFNGSVSGVINALSSGRSQAEALMK